MGLFGKFVVVSIVLAFGTVAGLAQTPVVTIQTDSVWHKNTVDNAYMNRQIAEAAEQYKEYAPIPRIAFYDIAYPKDKSEFVQLNGYGLILISTMAQDENELPLKRVYVFKDGKDVELKLLEKTFIKEVNLNGQVSKTFGLFRVDSIFLFPIFLKSSSAELRIDFAKNRNGMKVASFDDVWPVGLSGLNGKKPEENKTFDAEVKVFMKREYPGYFKN